MGQRVEAVLRQLEKAQAFVQRPRETPGQLDFERALDRPAPPIQPVLARKPTPLNDVRVDVRPRGGRPEASPTEPGIQEAEEALQNLGRVPSTLRRLEEIEFDAARVGDILVQARQAVVAAARGTATGRNEEFERVPMAEARSLTASRTREQAEQTARLGVRGTESVPVPERNAFVRGPVAQRLGISEKPDSLEEGPAARETVQPEVPRRSVPSPAAAEPNPAPRREEPLPAAEPRRRSEEQNPPPPQRLQEALQSTVASSNIHQNVSGMGDIRPGNA